MQDVSEIHGDISERRSHEVQTREVGRRSDARAGKRYFRLLAARDCHAREISPRILVARRIRKVFSILPPLYKV